MVYIFKECKPHAQKNVYIRSLFHYFMTKETHGIFQQAAMQVSSIRLDKRKGDRLLYCKIDAGRRVEVVFFSISTCISFIVAARKIINTLIRKNTASEYYL